jgi:flagellar hook protein FlgE
MPNTLLTGASGLLSHQRMLDVVANNLANLNTTAYKTQRIVFSDTLYQLISPATAASSGTYGGTNPNQIGSGVKMAQISRKHSQGNLQITGNLFDFAIQGEGFFTMSNGPRDYFTRAGAFSLDGGGNLVDPATGYLAKRIGTYGEASADGIGFQIPGESNIQIPIGIGIPGEKTTLAEVAGNLPSSATPPLGNTHFRVPFPSIGGSC